VSALCAAELSAHPKTDESALVPTQQKTLDAAFATAQQPAVFPAEQTPHKPAQQTTDIATELAAV
jgi:type II secretory pathway predicted ATPase ExeA